MLVLSRRETEKVNVKIDGKTMVVKLLRIRGDRALIGFEGPTEFQVTRTEIEERDDYEAIVDSQPDAVV